MIRRVLYVIGALIAVAAVLAIAAWVKLRPVMAESITKVDDNLWVFMGGGGNSVVLLSQARDQALVVDTKTGGGARRLKALVAEQAPNAVVTIVNTHAHSDHTGGNGLFAGARVITGECDSAQWEKLSGGVAPPAETIAPDHGRLLRIGDEYVEIRGMGAAHSFNDVIVYLHNRKMLVAGDIVFNQMHPVVFTMAGADTRRWQEALTTLLREYEIHTAVPGHGPVGGWEIIMAQRDYFRLIRESLDNPKELAVVERAYRASFSVPVVLTFRRVVKHMRGERH
jgi:cyclase